MKNKFNFKSLFRISLVALSLMTVGVGNVWADTWLYGSFQSWVAKDNDYKFTYDGSVGNYYLELEANTEYEFKIIDGDNYYSMNNANYTTTTEDQLIYTGNGNCKVTTGEAGIYVFKTWWAGDNRHFSIYFPQARLVKQKYIYFDVRNQTNWNSSDFDARFWFKYYDSGSNNGSVDCNKGSALENWVYYALVPDNDYIGQIQMNRLDPSNHDEVWCTANIAYAKDRTASAQNCLKEESGKADYCIYWTPQWTTYCPPMSSVTLADNGTTNWGGNGSSSTPYLVPTSGDIKVHVTASASALDDANMTKYFLFKKAGSAVGSGSSSTDKTITASGTTGTKEAVIVEAYNYYNSTEGTHLASSAIYYEARTPYTISYNAGTGGSGSRASETKLKGVNFTLPNSAVFERTGYTQTGWTTSDGGSQTHALGGSYTGDVAQEFFPVWTPKTYTINLANMEATTAGTTSVTVTFDASTNMTSAITKPTKTHYNFGGYWTSENTGTTLDHQLIDANGNWIANVTGYTGNDGAGNPTWVHDYPISLYAKWTEHEYSITMDVSPSGAGTTSPSSSTTGKFVTASGDITATPAAGYKFKEWQFSKTGEDYDVYVSDGDTYHSTDPTIRIKAQHNGTLTAVFEPRYSLVGSLQDNSGNGGMPGWVDYTKTFTVNSSSPVDLTRTCTLQANKTYKLQVHDLATSTNLGRSGCNPVCVLEENASLVMENSNNDVFLYTGGAGEYIFKITAVDGSGHPTLTVLRPYPVNFGQKYEDIDGTLHAGTTGGTAAATAGGALTSGDYVTYNTSVTHTATPAGGYTFAGWWSSDAFEDARFSGNNPMTYAVTSGDNAYAKFVETSTAVTLANDGNGKVQIGGEDATSTTCGVTTTRSLTAVPDAGYKFKNWTTSSSPDFEVDDDDAAEVTLTGHGDGTAGTLTANFEERYSIKGTMNGENWSTTHTLSNIGTNAGSKDTCYVTMTLPANTTYEFAIYDEQTGDWYKAGSDRVYYMTYTNHTNWEFGDTKTYNCGITTAGKGTYKFIFNITDKTVTVVYQTSYQVNYGASVGGSVSVVDDDSQTVLNGEYVRSGGSVTYTPSANSGYSFAGWYTNDTYGTWFSNDNPWVNSSITAASNGFAKFTSDNFVIYRSGDKAEDPRAALDDVESYAGGTISEKIEYRMKVGVLDQWYSLCLPFTVDSVCVWDEDDSKYYKLVPYYRTGGMFYLGHYVIRTPELTDGSIAITNFGDWRDPESAENYVPAKNTPYIIQWHDDYFLNRYVSFFGAANQDIPTSMSQGSAPVSDNVVNIYGNNAMVSGSVKGAYVLVSDYGAGAWLRGENAMDNTTVPPFECFIRASTTATGKYLVIRRDMTVDDAPTGWDDIINSEPNGTVQVYTLSGLLVAQWSNCSINEAAERLRSENHEGLFILHTDNENVKLMLGGK